MRRERVGFEEEKKRESVSEKKKRRFAGVGESDWWHPTTRSRVGTLKLLCHRLIANSK
ncbi:hypothetical protein Sjap_006644 [Stephania japonica]|uniref:Uncharacterized protein n=1 Tax=Stephania japonica TaxID=461633 RepID=A0AAP0PN05_9MAGN